MNSTACTAIEYITENIQIVYPTFIKQEGFICKMIQSAAMHSNS